VPPSFRSSRVPGCQILIWCSIVDSTT
jgi:hypothetical protein